ncbi:signal transduction histidine kinase [Candidatus Symbiobacter mobilis CR]|uniref:Virulence sensor protein BvgS n=2 Tax=Candidatus Symbiobacter TaxID=1436289 RepID=U5NBE1_9BURK|nr:signal transduction histidine kinase [Candidatus Symbiobacter mobilis CR]
MKLETKPFSLEDVLAQALGMVRQRAQEKELELLCNFLDPSLLMTRSTFLGDELRLTQVLTNLLSNAVKFTSVGQVRVTVDTYKLSDELPGALSSESPSEFFNKLPKDVEKNRVGLSIAVHDTGIGMTAQQMEGLFREFSQADESTTRRFGGTGLGLAICKRLVELMGGTLSVRSQPDQGSVFELRVCLGVPDVEPVPSLPPEVAGLRVLVAEDHPDSQAMVLSLLQHIGVGSQGALVGANNGVEALERLTEARRQGKAFDIVFLDWILPDIDGSDVLRRARTEHPALRIVVMSSSGIGHMESAVHATTCQECIEKPLLPEPLRRLFQKAGAGAPESVPTRTRLDGLRVLLVEDNPLNRELATELLVGRGALVDLAVHGLEAVERLRMVGPTAYHVVLMDLQMPVMDGYEAIARIRQLAEFHELPVFAMTADAMTSDRDRCLTAGMQGHVAKPLDPSALFALLERYLPETGALPQHPDHSSSLPGSTANAMSGVPQIPGLDLSRALLFCDNNETVLRKLFSGFVHDYGDGLHPVPNFGAWHELVRTAHTLRGLAGSIGANAVQVEATNLEKAAKDEDPIRACESWPRLHVLLQETAKALERWQICAAPTAGESSILSEHDAIFSDDSNSDTTNDVVAQLFDLIKNSDSQALELWAQYADSWTKVLSPRIFRKVSIAMKNCDFDAALTAFEGTSHSDFMQRSNL